MNKNNYLQYDIEQKQDMLDKIRIQQIGLESRTQRIKQQLKKLYALRSGKDEIKKK